jgi:hypothetical protein
MRIYWDELCIYSFYIEGHDSSLECKQIHMRKLIAVNVGQGDGVGRFNSLED